MPSEANTKRAEELLPCDCDQPDGVHHCPRCWRGEALALALDAAEQRGREGAEAKLRRTAKSADEYAKLLLSRADAARAAGKRREAKSNVAAAGEHEHAARVLRGVLRSLLADAETKEG